MSSVLVGLNGARCTGLYRLRSLLVDYAEAADLTKVVHLVYVASSRLEAVERILDAYLFKFKTDSEDPSLLDIHVCSASTDIRWGLVRFRHGAHRLTFVKEELGQVLH